MTVQAEERSRAELLRTEVGMRVWRLQGAFLDPKSPGNADATATLARLRRCPPEEPGADPRVWEITLAELPEKLRGGDVPSYAERAIHACLVLYAFHQQSNEAPVNQSGIGLGSAAGTLARMRGTDEEPDEPTVRRLHQVVLANDFSGRLHHLRGLIALMRAESPPVPLDYALLAVDLWRLLDPRENSDYVTTRWGRDLHNRPRNKTTGEPK